MLQRLTEISKELTNKNTELRRLDKMKDEFLALTTHELKYATIFPSRYIDLIFFTELL